MSDENDSDDEPEAQPLYPEKGPNREEMAAEYLPGEHDWEAKTILDVSDPAAVAALSEMGEMYPEVSDLQPLIDEFMHHFLKSRTSVGGESRQDYRDILISQFGGNVDENARDAIVSAFAGDLDD